MKRINTKNRKFLLLSILFIVILAISIVTIVYYPMLKQFDFKNERITDIFKYKLLIPVYVAPEADRIVSINSSSYSIPGTNASYSDIPIDFYHKGFLVLRSTFKAKYKYEITYTCIDYNGRELWSVNTTRDQYAPWKDFLGGVSPDMSILYKEGIKEARQFERYWSQAIRFSPDGKYFGTAEYKNDGADFSLYKDGALLWKEHVNFLKGTPYNGEYVMDILVRNTGDILFFVVDSPSGEKY